MPKKANNTAHETIVEKVDINQSKFGGLKDIFNFFTCCVILRILLYLTSNLKKKTVSTTLL